MRDHFGDAERGTSMYKVFLLSLQFIEKLAFVVLQKNRFLLFKILQIPGSYSACIRKGKKFNGLTTSSLWRGATPLCLKRE